jgi:hypothetical protein
MATADFSTITDAITGTLTSSTAVAAYESVLTVGLAIGVVIKLGPMLFRYVWRFLPDESGFDEYYSDEYSDDLRDDRNADYGDLGEPWHENSDGSWAFDADSAKF